MLLDHVAELAEVMDQQALAALVFVAILQRLQQVADQILEFAFPRLPPQ